MQRPIIARKEGRLLVLFERFGMEEFLGVIKM